jgi:hypothetical protein
MWYRQNESRPCWGGFFIVRLFTYPSLRDATVLMRATLSPSRPRDCGLRLMNGQRVRSGLIQCWSLRRFAMGSTGYDGLIGDAFIPHRPAGQPLKFPLKLSLYDRWRFDLIQETGPHV